MQGPIVCVPCFIIVLFHWSAAADDDEWPQNPVAVQARENLCVVPPRFSDCRLKGWAPSRGLSVCCAQGVIAHTSPAWAAPPPTPTLSAADGGFSRHFLHIPINYRAFAAAAAAAAALTVPVRHSPP